MDRRTSPELRKLKLWRIPWLVLFVTVLAVALAVLAATSLLKGQIEQGCEMAYMWPNFVQFPDFNSEYTRFSGKYSLFLYREGGIDEDPRVKGVPVLFIPGNAGNYKQGRSWAAEAAHYFDWMLKSDEELMKKGKRSPDFFVLALSNEFSAFHGHTLLSQAEYTNDAIDFILQLYENEQRALRDPALPKPTSIIVVGHSMGGIVARASMLMPNYRQESINTIITLATPHARAPISFDRKMVQLYRRLNDFWLEAFAKRGSEGNPLRSVALVSIAGGTSDSMISSDYTAVSRFVPPTNGFTVFTSAIPETWVSTDHLCILWCDQLRKRAIRALFDIIDARQPSQTLPISSRMKFLRRWLLSGFEEGAQEKPQQRNAFLTLPDEPGLFLQQGELLSLRQLGSTGNEIAHVMSLPPVNASQQYELTLLSNQKLYEGKGAIEVLFCSAIQTTFEPLADRVHLSGGFDAAKFSCSSSSAFVAVPASTLETRYPWTKQPSPNPPPFSLLQHDIHSSRDDEFLIIVVDRNPHNTPGWLIAEVSPAKTSHHRVDKNLFTLLLSGYDLEIGPQAPLKLEIELTSTYSSLLAWSVKIDRQECPKEKTRFAPLARISTADPHESQFLVNMSETTFNLHGVPPYTLPKVQASNQSLGLTIQIWSDPACNGSVEVLISVDLLQSLGKLWMRYRTTLATLPLLVVAMVTREQWSLYDHGGSYMGFAEALNVCLRRGWLFLFFIQIYGIIFSSNETPLPGSTASAPPGWQASNAMQFLHFLVEYLLDPARDKYYWLVFPLLLVIAIGLSVILDRVIILITETISLLLNILARGTSNNTHPASRGSNRLSSFLIFTSSLAMSIFIPSQFAFIVLVLVQWSTCIRALRIAEQQNSLRSHNFFSYAHTTLTFMVWLLPINVPPLIVFAKDMAQGYFPPVSLFENIIAVAPFSLLVGQQCRLRMPPRQTSIQQRISRLTLHLIIIWSATVGIAYAFALHYLVGMLLFWLGLMNLIRPSDSVSEVKKRT